MHTIWKGALSFGLVHLPIKMHSTTEDKDIAMKYLHRNCGSNISYVKTCTTCEKEVLADEIVKGFEYNKGSYVLFEKDELDDMLPESNKEIRILDFVNLGDIDPIYYQKTYYLSPNDNAIKAYVLLTEALKTTGKIGLCSVSIRSKSSLAVIRVIENCLVMETMHYHDEIRQINQVPNLPQNTSIIEKELKLAQSLITQLSVPFEPSKYQDSYRNQLFEVIESKISGNTQITPEVKQRTNVLDLMTALQASLEALKNNGTEDGNTDKKKKRKKQINLA